MKLFATVIVVALFFVMPTAPAVASEPAKVAQAAASPDTASSTTAPQFSGSYIGHVGLPNGDNGFDVTIQQNGQVVTGKMVMYKGPAKCRGQFSLAGTVSDDGTITLTTPGSRSDCNRVLVVKNVGGNQWDGTIGGPMGGPFPLIVRPPEVKK